MRRAWLLLLPQHMHALQACSCCVRDESVENSICQWWPSRVIHAEPAHFAVARGGFEATPKAETPHGAGLIKAHRQCVCCDVQVFDVELHAVHSCRRRQFAMFSDVVCDS